MKLRNVILVATFLIFANFSTFAVEYGMASMFSDNFHGKKTASGELYDVNKMTAAHKSLPFGSKIKITRMDNQQSIVVRINDRGPYLKGRVVELSRKAAREIGLSDGEVKVKIEVLTTEDDEAKPIPAPVVVEDEPEVKPKPKVTVKGDDKKKKIEPIAVPKPAEKEVTPPKAVVVKVTPKKEEEEGKLKPGELIKVQVAKPEREGFGVQVASLEAYDAAMRKVAELESDYFKNILIFTDKNGAKPLYKIILGPFPDVTTADAYKVSAKKKKMSGFVISLRTMERP